MICPPELLTRSEVITLGGDTLEVIRVVLEAVLGLVCLREPGVETGSLENVFGRELRVGHCRSVLAVKSQERFAVIDRPWLFSPTWTPSKQKL